MQLRTFAPADLPELMALWNATKRAAYSFLPLEQTRTVADDTGFFTAHVLPRCQVWVAEAGGRLLGFLAIDGGYIDRLYVAVDAQRRGVGGALIEYAKGLSPTGLELHTHQKNFAACRFYERHGFTAVEFGVSPPPESEPDVRYRWEP